MKLKLNQRNQAGGERWNEKGTVTRVTYPRYSRSSQRVDSRHTAFQRSGGESVTATGRG